MTSSAPVDQDWNNIGLGPVPTVPPSIVVNSSGPVSSPPTSGPPSPGSQEKDTDNDYVDRVPTNSKFASNTSSAAAQAATEKSLVRKLDCRILPIICLSWMLFYLDRAAIGFALINGLVRELRLHGVQINVMMMLYYVPFLILSIPGNLVIRRVGAGRLLSAVVTAWGTVTICTGFVKSYEALCVMRILMGISESFFLGGVMLYLGFFYTSKELTSRTGIFYSSTSIAAAIGGLLASGLGQIHTGNYYGWSWIFFIEGVITVIIGLVSWFVLPVRPEACGFFTPAERGLAISRMQAANLTYQASGVPSSCAEVRGPSASMEAPRSSIAHLNRKSSDIYVTAAPRREKLGWKVVKRAMFNPVTPMMALACFFNIEALTSYIMFLPTIVASIFNDGNVLRANLLTVPPNIAAFIATIAITQWSQRWGRSGIPIIFCALVAAFGFVLLLVGSTTRGPFQIVPSIQYVGTFFVGMGVSSMPPIALAWCSVNSAPHYVRALVLGIVIMFGSSASFLSSFTYVASEAPKYITGHSINLGCLCTLVILGVSMLTYMKWENRKRERGERDDRLNPRHYDGMSKEEYEFHLGWDHPSFRFQM
ncbi:hypothetical protein TD95_004106 [Thielaviopsis punctulata]|uniref:Major facilitator superfamily (MFS) profile domain-containing protein n=1 Tax=Thielaviopsis punctulata TaxID=72032 RepID=A0A0F4ZLK8_9PEZI|nr:hypothetical protein TD95_004106 [Thielaviopsis punctulata]